MTEIQRKAQQQRKIDALLQRHKKLELSNFLLFIINTTVLPVSAFALSVLFVLTGYSFKQLYGIRLKKKERLEKVTHRNISLMSYL